MILKYIASSGREYHLNTAGALTKEANFHSWGWTPVETNLQFGARISGFKREPLVYKASLVFYGSYAKRKATIDALHEDFELDVRNNTPGRIVWGDYYIDCYITECVTAPEKVITRTGNDIEIYCPYPFWIRERKQSFYKQATSQGGSFLDYTYDFEYDYYVGDAGSAIWQTGIPFESAFEMVIYGAATNPRIVANGYPYKVNVTLEAGEYLILNTKEKTITHHKANGTDENAFDLRDKENSVFNPMPAGDITFGWPGTFGFDITIFEERSEPR